MYKLSMDNRSAFYGHFVRHELSKSKSKAAAKSMPTAEPILQMTPYYTVNPILILSFLHRHILTRAPIIIMCHLQSCPLVSALDIESLVRFAAVENAFVAADLLGDEVEGLNQFQAEFLALLVLRDGDVFDVSDESEMMNAIGALAIVN